MQPSPKLAANTTTQHAPARSDPIAQLLNDTRPYVRNAASGLRGRVEMLEELLPRHMHGQAMRLIAVAMATISRDDKLKDCPTEQFVKCVFDAASIGLAIDGKRGYIVRYKSVYQFLADYKALVDLARQNGVIKDCYGRIVCENDEFEIGEENGEGLLHHRLPTKTPRGPTIGSYAKVILPDGSWRTEYMTLAELDDIKARSPAKDKQGRAVGPWATDTGEMQKKTVVRRAMKMYVTDPTYAKAMREPWEQDSFTPDDYLETQPATGALANGTPPANTTPVEDWPFVKNMDKRDAHFVSEKLSEAGEYRAALIAEGHRAGWPERLEHWPAGPERVEFTNAHFTAYKTERLDAKKDAPLPTWDGVDEPPAFDSAETLDSDESAVWVNWLTHLMKCDTKTTIDVMRKLNLVGTTTLTDLTFAEASEAGSWLTNGRETRPPTT